MFVFIETRKINRFKGGKHRLTLLVHVLLNEGVLCCLFYPTDSIKINGEFFFVFLLIPSCIYMRSIILASMLVEQRILKRSNTYYCVSRPLQQRCDISNQISIVCLLKVSKCIENYQRKWNTGVLIPKRISGQFQWRKSLCCSQAGATRSYT